MCCCTSPKSPNTGNVIRLCANTGARLHLIEPLGFDLDDRQLKRAGLDYHEYARMQVHPNLSSALAAIAPRRLFALSTRGQVRYDTPTFRTGDAFIFGPETRGLPDTVLHTIPGISTPVFTDATTKPQLKPLQCRRGDGI